MTVYVFNALGNGCSHESSFVITIQPNADIDSRADVAPCNGYILTPLSAGNYYTGPNGTGTLLNEGDVVHESATIYIYAAADNSHCASENSFDIDVFILEADAPAPVQACDLYVLQPLTIGNYYTLSGGPNTIGNVELYAGDAITQSATLFIYTESGERLNCFDENTFQVTITNTPIIASVSDVQVCDQYVLPALTVGNYYTGSMQTGTQLMEGDVISSTQQVYVYAANGNCSAEKSFTVTVYNVPQLPNVITCSSYTLPALATGGYFTGPSGTGIHMPAGSVINTSKTVYVYAVSPYGCFDETAFTVTIVPAPIANQVSLSLVTQCDEDGTNDGITVLDTSTLTASILGGQIGNQFVVSYYESMDDANSGTNPVAMTSANPVFAKVVNLLAPDCYAVRSVTKTVHQLPEPTPASGYICYDAETQTLLNPYIIYSGLNSGSHTFEWYDDNNQLVSTSANYTAITPGNYSLIATNNATGCSSEPVTITVTASEPAQLTYSTSDSFNEHATLTIHAIGTGNYEYSVDGGTFQPSPNFEGLSSGTHEVAVKDVFGCDTATISVILVNYPHYFTPNNDGFGDTWNIKDLQDQSLSTIQIFDRYGKFITTIKPNGAGWDGTMNGRPLPSTDYWFTVKFMENGKDSEFRSHFAMKR